MSSPSLTREEMAQRDIGQTDVPLWLAWLLIVVFGLTLSVPAIVQLAYEVRSGKPVGEASALRLVSAWPQVDRAWHSGQGLIAQAGAANDQLLLAIREYERQLEDQSLLTDIVLPPARELLVRWGGVGAGDADTGQEGWLFFRTDTKYLTGPGFLLPDVLHRRSHSDVRPGVLRQPDPRPAIVEFHEQLAAQGIQLIIVPVPGKQAVYPEPLAGQRTADSGVRQNPSFDVFVQSLEGQGLVVLDPGPLLARAKQANPSSRLFLQTDTHWTPAGVELVASELKNLIHRDFPLPPRQTVVRSRQQSVTNSGDLTAMLRLPESQSLFPEETVTLRQMIPPDDLKTSPDAQTDVLLLGDSFSNIYSLADMNWGSSAGLAEQLSLELQRPVDCLALNGGGASDVRRTLVRDLARGRNWLAGKRIVVWEFAVRELAFGDWQRLPLPPESESRSTDARPTDAGNDVAMTSAELLVRGTVQAIAAVPDRRQLPYPDAVISLHLVDVTVELGRFGGNELIVYAWGLRQRQLTSAAQLVPGQPVRLRLMPWDQVRADYERFNRLELDDPDFRLVDLPVFWAQNIPVDDSPRNSPE